MIGATVKEVGVLITKSTCQLLNNKAGTKEFPVPNGCSVLLEFNNNFYCISNAHVLADNNYGKTYFLEGRGITSNMGGKIFNSNPGDGEPRSKDIFDLAVVQLASQTVAALKRSGKSFISINDIKTGHKLSKSDTLFFVGYPASKTQVKISETKTVQRRPFFFLTHPVLLSRPKNAIHTTDFHVIAKYSKSKTRNFSTHDEAVGPSPRGMSGSGIWLISEVNFEIKAELVGIFSEYHENRSILIGSKIDLYIDLIKQEIDSTIPNSGIKIKLLK